MKLLFRVLPLLLFPLISSCVEDHCKTCESTTYYIIEGGQVYMLESVKEDYCGEELQEMIDLDYTTGTMEYGVSENTVEFTTFITCY